MVKEVEPATVADAIDSEEELTVLDIRSRGDFARGHVPGAINVPLPELPQRIEEHDWGDEEVVCVCAIGESSIQAARLLASYEAIDGDAVASMAGGYREWTGDLESGSSSATADPASVGQPDDGPDAPF